MSGNDTNDDDVRGLIAAIRDEATPLGWDAASGGAYTMQVWAPDAATARRINTALVLLPSGEPSPLLWELTMVPKDGKLLGGQLRSLQVGALRLRLFDNREALEEIAWMPRPAFYADCRPVMPLTALEATEVGRAELEAMSLLRAILVQWIHRLAPLRSSPWPSASKAWLEAADTEDLVAQLRSRGWVEEVTACTEGPPGPDGGQACRTVARQLTFRPQADSPPPLRDGDEWVRDGRRYRRVGGETIDLGPDETY